MEMGIVIFSLSPGLNYANYRRVDYLGGITLVAALVAALVLFLVGLDAGGNLIAWDSKLVLTTLPLSAVFLGVFICVERYWATEPLLPLHLIQNRTVLRASITYSFDHMAAFGVLYYIPVYIQVLGHSSTDAGLRLLPNSAGQGLGALTTGIIIRKTGRYFQLNIISHLFTMLGSGPLIRLALQTPAYYPLLMLGIIGLGFGALLVINLTAVISSVKREDMALATSVSFVFRSVGSTLGVTLTSAVFQNVLRQALWKRLGDLPHAATIIGGIRGNFNELGNIDTALKQDVLDSYMLALVAVFATTFGMSVLAALANLFMKENKLHADIARTEEQVLLT